MRAEAKKRDRPSSSEGLSAANRSAASPSTASQDPWRERILATAAEVFARDGYQDTDLQVVADALGIGKASVYRRFPSKQELFLAAVDDGMRRMKQNVDAAIERVEDPLEQISVAVVAYLAFFDAEPRLAELLILERARFKDRKKPTYFEHREANIHRWRALYERLMLEGKLRRMPVDRITDVLSNLVYGTMFTNHFAGRTKPFEQQAADILDVFFHGVLAERTAGERTRKRRRS
jgi:AcrR family transcriptional regulator